MHLTFKFVRELIIIYLICQSVKHSDTVEQDRETLLQTLVYGVSGQYSDAADEDRKQRCQSFILQERICLTIIILLIKYNFETSRKNKSLQT